MAANDGGGLFGAPAAAAAAPAAAAGPRREKLKRWDHVAVQALDPQGKSAIHDTNLKSLWKDVTGGNKAVAFHSCLASDEKYRAGVGWSQTAQSLLVMIEEIKEVDPTKPTKYLGQVLKPDIFKKVHEEALSLEPHLKVMNAGKGSQATKEVATGFGNMRKKQRTDEKGPLPTDDAINQAVDVVYAWLNKEHSPLRGVLSILSNGGVYYQAACAEKTARACISKKPMTKDEVKESVKARLKDGRSDDDDEAAPNDVSGLFGV